MPIVQVRYNDLKLYENRTDPDGPAMTHSMFAIGWLDLGENKKAEKPFLKNYENIRGPFKVSPLSAPLEVVFVEMPGRRHIFIASSVIGS